MTDTITDLESRINLIDGDFWGRNPQDELSWLRANAPVWRDPSSGIWGVSTYPLVKHVSGHPQLFTSTGGIRPDYPATAHMIDMDDPAHALRRKLVSRGFTPRRVRDQEMSIRATVTRLIDGFCEQGECDLVWDLAAWLPLIVIADALGFDPKDRPDLLKWSDDMMRMLGKKDPETVQRGARAVGSYMAHVTRLADERRQQPGEDLLSVLVTSEVAGQKLDEHEVLIEALLILIGGDETTRHVISGGAYQLLREPARWGSLIAEPDLIPSAVEESLRWVSPVKNMARTTTEDLDLGGQQIPSGEQVLLLYPSANRDESIFRDPFDFDVRRHPNEHVAFGFGPHFCLGASLARLEIRVALEELVARCPDLALVDETEPDHRPANFVSGYEGLKVRFTPSAPKQPVV